MLDESSIHFLFEDVLAERRRQDSMWGEQNHPDGTGELGSDRQANQARVTCDQQFEAGLGAWADILKEEVYEAIAESDVVKLREELVQVAAVCMAWIEAIDRRIK